MKSKLSSISGILLIINCLIFYSCRTDKSSMEIEKVVKEWTGKEIIFPQKVTCISMNKETTCIPPNSTPYKILVYIDSTGCTSCKLQLYKWNTLIDEVKNEMQDLVNFQFYVHPKDIKEIQTLLLRDSFKYPSHIDATNQLDKLNNLPKNSRFQTFLLDKDNKVIVIGNPVNNLQIWSLYKQIIKGNENINSSTIQDTLPITSLKIKKQIVELKGLVIDKTSTARFTIKNTGKIPLVITNISVTCGCTVPKWSKQPIFPNDTTEIIVQVTPNEEGYFKKTITVNCNIKGGMTTLIVKGIVENLELMGRERDGYNCR